MTEDQRKRQQEVLASVANYSDAAWDIILARWLLWFISRRKELAKQRAQERRDRPMTPAQLRQYMRTYVKNQGPAVYSTGWTMAQVRKLSPEQLQEEFDKIQRAVAFTRGLKRDGSPMSTTSSKKHKTGDVEVDVEAPSHGVSQEVEVEAPSQDVSREKVDAPSHSQTIPEVQAEVPSQEATVEDVEVPSNIASKAHPTASSLKKIGTKKKRLGRKGSIHPGSYIVFWCSCVGDSLGIGYHMFVDRSILSLSTLSKGCSDHQLEICTETVSNESFTAVQLIAFLKKQISDSRRPKVHEFSAASSTLLPFNVQVQQDFDVSVQGYEVPIT
ncbi:hypothetical protein Tco_0078148 [Tanacetum coccineum]